MSSSRPPLTAAQLRTIYETNPSPAVKRLLWEISRLRGTILMAEQVANRLGETGVTSRIDTTTKMLLENLAERLQEEPACQERAGKAADMMTLFDKTAKKR